MLARAGATINELNIFRKSLSQIKGGKLAEAAFPAKVGSGHHNRSYVWVRSYHGGWVVKGPVV